MQNILIKANQELTPGYEFKTVDKVNHEDLVHLVAETFSAREPLQGDVRAYENWRGIVKACLKYKSCAETSFVLVQNSTQQIAGFAINMDHDELQMNDLGPFLIGDEIKSLRLLLVILDYVECDYAKKTLGKKMFYMFLGGTHVEFEGHGFGKAIRALTLKIGEELGFDYFSVSASNPATQHIWKKLGLNIEKQCLMKDAATLFSDNAEIVEKYSNYPNDRDALVMYTMSYK